ncbi:hypothetical protein F0L74_20445 [Chitinophaga agrisoli]|uniref:Tetratricopeptide repeat protein n=1 Tax=Chitinophaga agrisoli TaxID=2607653 RepID=A0A5B2VJ86_9BACT|nr:hypothetical protein [Chitinophaga agrisoli]KAA2238596.1 hypothetical protein F0L74_20445 [Chitinophaga agrisoli]
MDRGKILEEYRNVLVSDSAKARSLIRKLSYKEDPYLLQCIAQTFLDESRFDENGKQRKEVYWRKWRVAERYIIQAVELDPDCPMVLSTMGSVRRSAGQNDIAIYCYEKIIKLGVKGAMSGKCKLDRDMAKELVNDSKFELYRLYYEDDPVLSGKYLKMYMKGLEKGARTIYRPLKRFLLETN